MALSLLVRRYSTKPSVNLEEPNDVKEETFDYPPPKKATQYVPFTPRKGGLKFL